MRWLKAVGISLLLIAVAMGCGQDEQTKQEIQKEILEKTQKEKQLYEGVLKGIDNLEKSIQAQQKGADK